MAIKGKTHGHDVISILLRGEISLFHDKSPEDFIIEEYVTVFSGTFTKISAKILENAFFLKLKMKINFLCDDLPFGIDVFGIRFTK